MVYGSTASGGGQNFGSNSDMQRFSIDDNFSENRPFETQNGQVKRLGCQGWEQDGLRFVVMSMVVLAFAVTMALIVQVSIEGVPQIPERSVGVVSDSENCSKIGKDVLHKGGNAVDAVVAVAFCTALMEPHVTGLGGGGVMLIHRHQNNESVVIDFRETSPSTNKPTDFSVPGFVKGLHRSYTKYGSGKIGTECCSWIDLVYMSIRFVLANGVVASESLATAAATKASKGIKGNLGKFLSGINNSLVENKQYLQLINTMKLVASHGADGFYRGQVANDIVKATGGIVSYEDLGSYDVEERKPMTSKVGRFEVMTSPSPSSGPKLLGFLKAMKKRGLKQGSTVELLVDEADLLNDLDLVQMTLGDPKFSAEIGNRSQNLLESVTEVVDNPVFTEYEMGGESVASHIASMDSEDTYVTLVTSLNTWFGSKVMTDGGVILNNANRNFAPSENAGGNTRKAGKRPLHNYVVALARDKTDVCGLRLLIGGATADAVGQVMLEPLLTDGVITDAVEYGRILVGNQHSFHRRRPAP